MLTGRAGPWAVDATGDQIAIERSPITGLLDNTPQEQVALDEQSLTVRVVGGLQHAGSCREAVGRLVVAGELAVWLYGERVALIDRDRGRPRLVYTTEALDRYALGTPLLSLSLPLANRRYTQGIVRPILDGLLPEGEPRNAIARDVGVAPTDTYGLIRELGRDCARRGRHPAGRGSFSCATDDGYCRTARSGRD